MSHNGPNPDRILANDPMIKAMALVAERYGELFTDRARQAIDYMTPLIKAGMPPLAAADRFEGRPMHERRYGRPAEDTVWGYEER